MTDPIQGPGDAPTDTFLARLIEFTIRNRGLVIFAALLLIVVGSIALTRLPFDAFPDTTPVMVQVNVSAPGWAPCTAPWG